MGLSTHVLDTASGAPAAGVPVSLSVRATVEGDLEAWAPLVTAVTDDDGRAALLFDEPDPGTYRLLFDTSTRSGFFPEIAVVVVVPEGTQRLHVPLLLSPFGYTTYRGS
ncbi:5-hydroxyisourate hydrolase [Quadrisphaera granulorum]|uniref:5-hydroxyisourate hydrolase n=1 Tax=Quadrisphaera granulorum TaxID=317664 RepID=A0A316A7Y3_9ACTN|nr:hydroxyisourate hydrolase [Quadrisphaera granulorum]PWJ52924.1 5-hydroxyisourate hydrolase [Quadrisphaera granulorum]SZE97306.1 5-hydroxyisourate hydrolase [Quadrisphaera granulorum]